MHRALVIGAGRIGASFGWKDSDYTHAGAIRALPDRVELVGFVEPDLTRRAFANLKWGVPAYDNVPFALGALKPDIVSVCVQPEQQEEVLSQINGLVKAAWVEKPWVTKLKMQMPVQVNYLRRGDPTHRKLAYDIIPRRKEVKLVVYGKDDLTTRCHFDDLAQWWGVELDYRPFQGPCAYALGRMFFDNGGLDRPGDAMKAMLENLLDCVDHGTTLWSPAYASVS